MPKFFLGLLLTFALQACIARSWHLQVHNQIAFAAEKLLSARALNITASLLDPKYNGSIGRAAAWADSVRKNKNGNTYSYNWHFVGMPESINITSPPSTCGYDWSKVCTGGGCVSNQIGNQSWILRGCIEDLVDGVYTPNINCQQALMWVVHFIGDVGQPLHTSPTKAGANGVSVKFNGTPTNLHDVWDRQILYYGSSHPSDFSDQQIEPYFSHLLTRINQDSFPVPRKDWTNCSLSTDGFDDSCPKRWAEDSHALVCEAVYKQGLDNVTDLVGSGYAKRMFPVVELQLAKAVWRMAAWLEGIVDGVYGGREGDEKLSLGQSVLNSAGSGRKQQVLR